MKTAISYIIEMVPGDPSHPITVECTKWDENGLPLLWAVKKWNEAMSKKTGDFNYEPLPSQRDEEYFKEYRFKTRDSAYNTYKKLHHGR